MVLVAQRIEDHWWWSWAFALLEVGTATVFAINAAVGVPDGAPHGRSGHSRCSTGSSARAYWPAWASPARNDRSSERPLDRTHEQHRESLPHSPAGPVNVKPTER